MFGIGSIANQEILESIDPSISTLNHKTFFILLPTDRITTA